MKTEKHLGQSLSLVLVFVAACVGIIVLTTSQLGV